MILQYPPRTLQNLVRSSVDFLGSLVEFGVSWIKIELKKNWVISGVKCEFKVKNVIVKIMHPLSFIDFGWSWVSCKGWLCFVGSCADVGHPGLEGHVRFRTVLGRFCRFLGMFWRVLVRFWRALVRFWRVLRRFWRVLGIFSLFFVMFWTFPSRFWRALDMITRYRDRF